METIGLFQQNSAYMDNSPFVLNLGLQDQSVRIFSGKNESFCTEIYYNPNIQEVSIRFLNTTNSTLTTKVEQNYVIKEPNKKTLWERYDQYIDKKRSEYSTGFIKQIITTRNNLKRFAENKEINFEDIDIQFLENFREYYVGKLGNARNSFAGNIKRLKFFMNYALKIGWTNNDKFKQFKAPERYGKVEYMLWEELIKLYNIDYKKENLNQVRDCFVFQSMIGCRHSDLKKLKKENYDGGILKFTTQKTGTQIEIPLSGIAKDLIYSLLIVAP